MDPFPKVNSYIIFVKIAGALTLITYGASLRSSIVTPTARQYVVEDILG